jgi:hypothetical protein
MSHSLFNHTWTMSVDGILRITDAGLREVRINDYHKQQVHGSVHSNVDRVDAAQVLADVP